MTEQDLCGRCRKSKGEEDGCCQCGRPPEYDPAYCDRVDEYIAQCKTTRTEDGVLLVDLPKLEGFAKFLGHSRQSLNNWAEQHPEFLDALDRIKAEQKSRLIDYGLAGTYNATITKLVLSSDHDVREKSERTVDLPKDSARALAGMLLDGDDPEPDAGTEEGDAEADA
jgi:hypothetical protein